MATFETTTAQQGNTGQDEIIVVNIQKLKDSDGRVNLQQYAVNIQRIFFLDEAHRDYNPRGSFLARLFESDPKAIRLALTGTPLIGDEFHGLMQLLSAVAATASKYISRQTAAVHAHQER